MKGKQFLFIILILVLLSNLSTTIIEGNTNCYNKPNINTATGRAKANDDCINTTIYSNELKSKDVTAKLNELKAMTKKITKNIQQNTKDINQNNKDSKALANVAAGNDNDQSEACKKYPSACQNNDSQYDSAKNAGPNNWLI